MKKLMVLAVVMAVAFAFVGAAYAADAVTTVCGKLTVKDKVASIKVSDAKCDGKAVADLKDKDLKVTGDKAADAAKLDGKIVEASGVVKGAEIAVAKIAEKKAEKKAEKPAEKKVEKK